MFANRYKTRLDNHKEDKQISIIPAESISRLSVSDVWSGVLDTSDTNKAWSSDETSKSSLSDGNNNSENAVRIYRSTSPCRRIRSPSKTTKTSDINETNEHTSMAINNQNSPRKARTCTPIPLNGVETNVRPPSVSLTPKPPCNTPIGKNKDKIMLPNGDQQVEESSDHNGFKSPRITHSTLISAWNKINGQTRKLSADGEYEQMNDAKLRRILQWMQDVSDAHNRSRKDGGRKSIETCDVVSIEDGLCT